MAGRVFNVLESREERIRKLSGYGEDYGSGLDTSLLKPDTSHDSGFSDLDIWNRAFAESGTSLDSTCCRDCQSLLAERWDDAWNLEDASDMDVPSVIQKARVFSVLDTREQRIGEIRNRKPERTPIFTKVPEQLKPRTSTSAPGDNTVVNRRHQRTMSEKLRKMGRYLRQEAVCCVHVAKTSST